MCQHFLLSAKARTLSIERLFDMNEAQAFDLFRELLRGKDGEQVAQPAKPRPNTISLALVGNGVAAIADIPSR